MTDRSSHPGESLLEDLAQRHLLHDHTDRSLLVDRLSAPTPLYCGFDPTADSLHIGNLQSIMLLRRFQLYGPPGIVFFDRGGKEIDGLRVVGFQSADEFLTVLARVN